MLFAPFVPVRHCGLFVELGAGGKLGKYGWVWRRDGVMAFRRGCW